MLRLWPDAMAIGLFPAQSWLRFGKKSLRREVPLDAGIDFLLAQLDAMFDEAAPRVGRFAHAEVFVSDSFSRSMLVPWQPALDTDDQIQGYGRACLESNGAIVDGEWAVHCGFRRHGAPGFVAALPASLVELARDRLLARGVRLQSVMPVAAAAYWYHRAPKSAGTSILLLEEVRRLTAFVYRGGQLVSLEVEPAFAGTLDASKRLFNRLQLAYGEIGYVDRWHAGCDEPVDREEAAGGIKGVKLSGARWSFA